MSFYPELEQIASAFDVDDEANMLLVVLLLWLWLKLCLRPSV
jgi:hypothetical protein